MSGIIFEVQEDGIDGGYVSALRNTEPMLKELPGGSFSG